MPAATAASKITWNGWWSISHSPAIGPSAIARLLISPNRPMPSPRRAEGMMSMAWVLAAVLITAKVTPMPSRTSTNTSTVCASR